MLLGGVLILSRPESLFSPPTNSHNITNNSGGPEQRDPHDGSYEFVGLMSAVAVPLLSALIVIITRQAKHVHYSVLVFWFGVGGLVVSIIGMFAIDERPLFYNWDDRMWILSFMVALVGILGSILMTKAVCWVTPSKVMVVRSFEVVAAYILQVRQLSLILVLCNALKLFNDDNPLQVTVFDIPTHWTDLIGTSLVVGAVISMGFEDCVMDRVNWKWI